VSISGPGRRRDLRARFSLEDNGIERVVIPGTDPARNPTELPLPPTGLPARLAARVVLIRFVTPDFVDGLTAAQVGASGTATRWVVAVDGVPTLGAIDSELQADELAWFAALQAAVESQPGEADQWLVVHTASEMPATVTVAIQDTDTADAVPIGFDSRLASLSVARDPAFASFADSSWLNGINYVVVVDQHPVLSERLRQRIVLVCLENAVGLDDLTAANLSIDGGIRVPVVPVRWVWPLSTIGRVVDPELTPSERTGLERIAAERVDAGDVMRWLVVHTGERGDFSEYRLRITAGARFDPLLSTATLRFKNDCPSSLDCQSEAPCPADAVPPPMLDYLARDFNGFRRLVLDRLAALGAADAEQNPAGLWSVLAELIAWRADQLAYAQDAVATEAYLHTARLRSSVRRHARTLDYRLHEGVNARAWVHVEAAAGVDRPDPIAVGDLFITRLLGSDAVLPPAILGTALPEETAVFHTILPLRRLAASHNAITIYAWGEDDLCLARGATSCTLDDPGAGLQLHAGDVLLFESIASASTGRAEDADPALRHVVRLAADPIGVTDPLLGQTVLEIAWMPEDALPFDLPVRQRGRPIALARGNLLLVAHGRPNLEELQLRPWGSRGRLYTRLSQPGLTWATSAPRWNGDGSRWSASAVTRQPPEEALPEIALIADDGVEWQPQRDLLASDRSAAEFWVEMESSGEARIRFGDDTTGRSPAEDARFVATYRTGTGTGGNVGAGAIAHLLSLTLPESAVVAVRNPLPASGGVEPESLDHARAAAPYAFRRQERAVTLDDWAEVAARSDDVQRAVATLRWSGSWHTVRVHVDRVGGGPLDSPFVEETTTRLDRYRLAGYDLEVVGPIYVPLDIVLTVCAAPGAWPEAVAGALQTAFGTGRLVDGTLAFFHPDNYTFGDSVYLSQIVARAMAVPGVRWVDTRRENPRNRMRRWSSNAPDQLESGVLRMGSLEVARCDSNPSVPERGRISFHVEGGS
jgi:hypothetical protein